LEANMNYRDWTLKRMAFKRRVCELLGDPRHLTYEEIGQMVDRSGVRVAQIRREMGIPKRTYRRWAKRPAAIVETPEVNQ
jgi:hypothetical protein